MFVSPTHSVFSGSVNRTLVVRFYLLSVLLCFWNLCPYLEHKYTVRKYFPFPVSMSSSESGKICYIFSRIVFLTLLWVLSLLTWFHICALSKLFSRLSVLRSEMQSSMVQTWRFWVCLCLWTALLCLRPSVRKYGRGKSWNCRFWRKPSAAGREMTSRPWAASFTCPRSWSSVQEVRYCSASVRHLQGVWGWLGEIYGEPPATGRWTDCVLTPVSDYFPETIKLLWIKIKSCA